MNAARQPEEWAQPPNEPATHLELKEEVLVPHKRQVDVGDAVIRTVVDEVPGHLDVEAQREEVKVTRVPVGETVSERTPPWEEGDEVVIPIYEEQLVVTKRLVLREQIRVQRMRTTEVRHFEDTVRRERLAGDPPPPATPRGDERGLGGR
jgi:uncharacterized protein (TIGR02271 family)